MGKMGGKEGSDNPVVDPQTIGYLKRIAYKYNRYRLNTINQAYNGI